MKAATATLKSLSPYGQNAYIQTPKLDKESAQAFEERTWRDRLHTTPEGYVFIPPMAFKNCLAESAKFLGMQIPGKGKATYTKHFEAGVLVTDGLVLPIKKEEVRGQWLFVPASGVRGDGKRVSKCFPVIDEWIGDVTFHILDDTITEDVFRHVLEEAGKFIGLGFFRPRNNGFWGRFEVAALKWS